MAVYVPLKNKNHVIKQQGKETNKESRQKSYNMCRPCVWCALHKTCKPWFLLLCVYKQDCGLKLKTGQKCLKVQCHKCNRSEVKKHYLHSDVTAMGECTC